AGRFLGVRLELIDRAVEPGVPLVDQLPELAENRRVRLGTMERGEELRMHRRIADDAPGVEQREEKLRVVRLEVREVRQIADLVSDHQLQIPERMQKPAQERLILGADRPLEQDQDVDIGMEREVPPSVAAEGKDG